MNDVSTKPQTKRDVGDEGAGEHRRGEKSERGRDSKGIEKKERG